MNVTYRPSNQLITKNNNLEHSRALVSFKNNSISQDFDLEKYVTNDLIKTNPKDWKKSFFQNAFLFEAPIHIIDKRICCGQSQKQFIKENWLENAYIEPGFGKIKLSVSNLDINYNGDIFSNIPAKIRTVISIPRLGVVEQTYGTDNYLYKLAQHVFTQDQIQKLNDNLETRNNSEPFKSLNGIKNGTLASQLANDLADSYKPENWQTPLLVSSKYVKVKQLRENHPNLGKIILSISAMTSKQKEFPYIVPGNHLKVTMEFPDFGEVKVETDPNSSLFKLANKVFSQKEIEKLEELVKNQPKQ